MVQDGVRRRRRQMFGEHRLLSEWLAETYFGRTWHMQYRVGADPDAAGLRYESDAERRLARNFNRWIDAIVEPPPELVVIEATMYRATEKIGRLQEYLLLLRASPDWSRWSSALLVPTLLTAQDDPVAAELCRRLGLRYVFWEPPWIDEWWAIYPDRRRRAPSAGLVDAIPRLST